MLKVAIIGAGGKMGLLAEEAVNLMDNATIVAKISRHDNLSEVLKSTKPDVAIELTNHLSVYDNACTILKNHVRPVIGSSGLSQLQIEEIQSYCHDAHQGGVFIPNFSIGVACTNKMVKELKQYFDDFAIVEFHHVQKTDKPSGTARYTANLIDLPEEQIASVRANGFLAKQQVYINSESERLIIDHESFSRKSFIKGIQISINKVMQLDSFIVGLEQIL